MKFNERLFCFSACENVDVYVYVCNKSVVLTCTLCITVNTLYTLLLINLVGVYGI